MNIAQALATAAEQTRRVRIPLRAQRVLLADIPNPDAPDGPPLHAAGDPDPADKPECAWFLIRRPDSMTMAQAGTAALLPAPGVMPHSGAPPRAVDPSRALGLTTTMLCAAVVGASDTPDGEPQPLTLVRTPAEQDTAAGRLYIGNLQAVSVNELAVEVAAFVGEGGDGFAGFRAE